MDNNFNIVSVNGEYISAKNFFIDPHSRAFRYGDGFFESMYANGQALNFINDHFYRITRASQALHIKLPDGFTIDYLQTHIKGLLHRCRLYQGAKVRVIISRKTGGLYIPKNNNANIFIEAEYLNNGGYEMNSDGLAIGLYTQQQNTNQYLSSFKTLNALPYVLAGIYADENNFNDVLILNKEGYVVEATSSNFFCMKDKVLYTPALKLGGVHGVMRKNIIELAHKMGYQVKEESLLTKTNLLDMDEMFLTNAISGIRWIAGLNKRRYYKRYSVKILGELNRATSSFQG